MIAWHRLFGLALCDFFTDSPWTVELERDLSLKKQLLDVIIVRREEAARPARDRPMERWPDGLEHLADHNLMTYKSQHDPLDDWALKELTGHYVNYRKQVGGEALLPEEQIALFGVSTRFPEKLASQMPLEPTSQAGIYVAVRGTDRIQVIVLNQIAREAHNSVWQLFSGVAEAVRFASTHYRPRTPDMSSVINDLYQHYDLKGLSMPYTWDDYRRDVARRFVHELTPDERLQGLSPDERLQGLSPDVLVRKLSPDDRLQGLTPDDRLQGLSPDDRLQGLSPDDRLQGLSADELLRKLSPEQIRAYLEKIERSKQPQKQRTRVKNSSAERKKRGRAKGA